MTAPTDNLRETCEDWLWKEDLLDAEEPDRATNLNVFVRAREQEAREQGEAKIQARLDIVARNLFFAESRLEEAKLEAAREALEKAAQIAFDTIFDLEEEPPGLADAIVDAIRALIPPAKEPAPPR